MEKNQKIEDDILAMIVSVNPNDSIGLARKITDYIIKRENVLHHYDISDVLEPYVNDKVKGFWKNLMYFSKENEFGVFPCQVGLIIERSMSEESWNKDHVTEGEYKLFGQYLNKVADMDLIGYGTAIAPAIRMPMAFISPLRRTMLICNTFSKKSYQELKEISNFFLQEGEIPNMIQNIKFNL